MGKRHLLAAVGCLAACVSVQAQRNSTDDRIENLETRVRMYPQDYAAYDRLGAAYLQKGRETADAAYYERAKIALSKSLDLNTNDPTAASAMTHMAVACMVEHRFDEALAWAERALSLGSGDPSPWAIAGDAYADMGDYMSAAEAYAKLESRFGSEDEKLGLAYERESRTSFLRFVAGDSQGAIRLMRDAARIAIDAHMPAENIAWSEFQLGEELFQNGELPGAEKAYLAALEEYPGYYRALAGLGKLRAAQGRWTEAADWYRKALAIVPYPEYAAALGDIYQKLHLREEAKKQYDLVEFIGYLNQVNQQIHNRELALFYADHDIKLPESLALAQKELDVRRDLYTWDVLAWSLFKNGQLREAAEAVSRALGHGTRDAQILFHAGMIYRGLGDAPKAKEFLERALALNPKFHIAYADVARTVLTQLALPSSTTVGKEARLDRP